MKPSPLAVLLAAGAAALVLTIALLSGGNSGVARAGARPVAEGPAAAAGTPEFVSGELIVRFDPSVRQVSRMASIANAGASVERDLRVPGYTLVRVAPGDERAAARRLGAEPGVTSVEPNYLRRVAFVPNDEHYDLQWNLPQIGLEQAWE